MVVKKRATREGNQGRVGLQEVFEVSESRLTGEKYP